MNGQVGDQTYHQVFSSIAGDRMSETLTVQQRVPASQSGVGVTVESRLAGIDVLAGADTREVSATNIEQAYFPDGRLRSTTTTPGYQRTSGVYVQGTAAPASAVTISLGLRGDVRQSDRPEGLFDGDSAVSPRAAVTWALQPR